MTQVHEAALPYLTDDAIVRQALQILQKRMKRVDGAALTSPSAARNYLSLHFMGHEAESFVVLFVDIKNRLIKAETMFTGSLTHTSVYPREVVKRALHHNAAAVLLSHNHPSGVTDPSDADKNLTARLQQALALVDIQLLDHIIVANDETYSFADNGLL